MFENEYFKLLIEKTLDELYEEEPELFVLDDSKKIKKHVGERAIVFRFGLYFQKELDEHEWSKEYKLDCEYNRNGADPKKIPTVGNRIYPDLILHKRNNNDGNLVVMEFKGWWNQNLEYDEKKIEKMVDKNGKFCYHAGYTILLGKNRAEANVNPILQKS